jgi:hypothetical protein
MPPSSNQNPTGNSKAAKFVAANPLAPLADPFSGIGGNNDNEDETTTLQKEVSNNVQKRLEKAMEELKEKHRTGTNEVDDVDRAPTGTAYRELHRRQRELAKAVETNRQREEERNRVEENQQILNVREHMRRMKENANDENSSSGDDDSGDEFDHLLDEEDEELTAIRQARIAQLKQQQSQHAMHLSLGHGSLRTITESEFLSECTGSSKYVIVHFYNDEFERCKIMDFHLKIVAREHMEAKFLRLDAGKAPFFVTKFRIRTLPSLFVYDEGREIGRLTGFDGLASNPQKPDEWHTGRLQEWLSETGAIRYEKPSEEVAEEMKRMGIVMRGAIYSDRERSGLVDEEC